MALAPWRSAITRSQHLNRSLPESRYFQLATLTPQGFPANRTVVFRGFQDNTNNLQMITDVRSEKVTHLQQYPQAGICWYFTKSREQFRLQGKISIITANPPSPVRQTLWEQISENARLQFIWPPPKAPRTATAFPETPPPLTAIPDTFVVLLFSPQEVDYLSLKGNPQNRYLYRLDNAGNWSMSEVNP